ncbi:Demethylsterigmatocystin 6-O-methyltransferase [Cladobotryum mycophilum]|uniref:Demethylsterigmatocystin 6-O-methyltransferase n=1 Tax=Cladobotryum mycophilum TaxID=491253 RepID=A0ABR0STN8_9HYPO
MPAQTSTYLQDLERDGFVVIRSIVNDEKLRALRAASLEVEQLARRGEWPHVRTVGKQFPPWEFTPEQGIWGVQHLMNPGLPGHDVFTELYFSDEVLGIVKELLQCEDGELVMELFNMLVRPDRDFELRWHRDDIPAEASPEEEMERLGRPAYHAQYNFALWEDDSLVLVPGSHKRARTETERQADPLEKVLPNQLVVKLQPGDIAFYNNNILHRGVYNSKKERMTLHGSGVFNLRYSTDCYLLSKMESPAQLRQRTAEVQKAIDHYEEDGNTKNYQAVQASLRRLQVAAADPMDLLSKFRLQLNENMAVLMMIDLGILDKLEAKNGAPATAEELAGECSCSEIIVIRLMRLATSLCFAEEMSENTYRANRITHHLSQPGWKGALKWMEIMNPIAGDVGRFLSTTGFGRTETPSQSLFEFSHGRPMWEVMKDRPDQRVNFNLWMHERKKHEETDWDKRYPPLRSLSVESLRTGPVAAVMVDVGGAGGSQLSSFREQFPHLPGRYVLQDLPQTIAAIKQVPEGIEAMEYDFFTPQPVKGARFYYLRWILHNWPDEKCVEILNNVVEAMDPEYSSLLIDGHVLPNTNASVHSAAEDMHMMFLFRAMERTESQFRDLLAKVGLEVVGFYPGQGMLEEAMLEAKIVKK